MWTKLGNAIGVACGCGVAGYVGMFFIGYVFFLVTGHTPRTSPSTLWAICTLVAVGKFAWNEQRDVATEQHNVAKEHDEWIKRYAPPLRGSTPQKLQSRGDNRA